MNGIAPFWSYRTLIAFVVAPPLSGVAFGFFAEFIHFWRFPELSIYRFQPESIISYRLFQALFCAFFGGIFGYPFAIVIITPVYRFILTRMRRVKYRHFLLLWLLISAIWILLTVDFGEPADNTLDVHALSDIDEIINSSYKFCLPTWIAITIFYLIVRRPIAREPVSEAA